MARALRILNHTGLLCATDLACVSRSGCSIGFAVCKRTISGDAGAVQGVDVCSQRRCAGVDSLVALSPWPRLPSGSRVGRTVRKGTPLEYQVLLGFSRNLGGWFRSGLFGAANLLLVGAWLRKDRNGLRPS